MDLEYEALMRNQTWEVAARDPMNNVVDCKWLFQTKGKLMVPLTGIRHG